MNRLFSAKSFLVAAVALGAVGAASAAHARTDVSVSIGLGAPAYVEPAPVYVQPHPVYAQPRPVYVEPAAPVYDGQRRFVQRTGAWGDWDRDGVPNAYDRDSRFYNPRMAHRHGAWGDADGDGVPNRFDRDPANPYRR